MNKSAQYIVRGAVISCDKGNYSTRLDIPIGHGIYMCGKPAAHDEDCVAQINIKPFGKCYSSTYYDSEKAVKNKAHPCILDLLERYSFVDESEVISNAKETITPIRNNCDKIRQIISKNINTMTKTAQEFAISINHEISENIANYYHIIWEKTGDLKNLYKTLEEIKKAAMEFAIVSSENCNYLISKNKEAANKLVEVQKSKVEIETIISEIEKLPKLKENYLITTESILVCRCGGIIRFEKSGQKAIY